MTRFALNLFSQTKLLVATISGENLGTWPIVIFVGIALFILLMVVLGAKQRGKKRRTLELMAGELGLQSMEDPSLPGQASQAGPIFGGRYRGREVRLFTFGAAFEKIGRDSGEMPMAVLDAVQAAFTSSDDFIFEVNSAESLLLKINNGLEPVPGDSEIFDQQFKVKSNNVRRAQAILTREVRDQLAEQKAQNIGSIQLTVRDGKVCYAQAQAFLGDVSRLTTMLDFACKLAEQIENHRA